jgi:hypothetical protein
MRTEQGMPLAGDVVDPSGDLFAIAVGTGAAGAGRLNPTVGPQALLKVVEHSLLDRVGAASFTG